MGIVVACRCGQAFEADAWLAGKVVQCPACRSPIAVPTPVAEAAPVYVPRPRSAVSHASSETAASIAAFFAAAVVIFVVVLGLSLGVVCYLKGISPVAWFQKPVSQETQVAETPAAPQSLLPATQPSPSTSLRAESPATALSPPTISPVESSTPKSALPSGWSFFDHATGGFSAAFPDSPTTLEREIEATSGNSTVFLLTLTHNAHAYEASREIRSYAIPSGSEAAAYEALLKMRASEMEEGKVEGSKTITLDGRLVCDAILRGTEEGRPVRKYLRLIISGDSVFQLACTVPPGSEQPTNINIFLGNYRLP